jgi:hypothetical protein
VEFQELEQRLGQIFEELLAAREKAQTGIDLVNKLMLELVRENATRKEEQDGGSDPIQR